MRITFSNLTMEYYKITIAWSTTKKNIKNIKHVKIKIALQALSYSHSPWQTLFLFFWGARGKGALNVACMVFLDNWLTKNTYMGRVLFYKCSLRQPLRFLTKEFIPFKHTLYHKRLSISSLHVLECSFYMVHVGLNKCEHDTW